MNRLYLAAFFLLLTASAASAQNPQTAITVSTKVSAPEAEKASIEVVNLFKQQKYGEALPLAEKAAAINLRELGAGHLKTAQSYLNLAYVLRALDKQKEAVDAFENAIAAFDKNSNLTREESLSLAMALESLGYLKFDAGREGGSEKHYKRALELRDKHNGAESNEIVGTLWSLGNLNLSIGDYDQAADFYGRAYQIRLKINGADNSETRDAAERYTCTLLKAGKKDDAEAFREKNKLVAGLPKRGKSVEGGVVNGKAIKLEKPPYPAAARKSRAEGAVRVRVMIDESGKVIYACGAENDVHPALVQASEWAAYQSSFNPTTLAGEPVKVIGVIVYNFVAR